MDALRQDIRYAFRALRRAPAVSALVVGSLALAIAGNTAVFSILNAVLFRPMPYEEPERLAWVGEYQDPSIAGTITGASTANFLDWRERQEVFQGMAAFTTDPVQLGPASGSADRAEPVMAARVSPELFPLLGVEARTGRTFLPEEGEAGADARVVVLTHGFWQSRLGGDPAVLDRTLTLDRADPGLVVSEVQPLDEFIAQFFVGMRVMTAILGAFGALALLLAALGTYGVLAYAVAQRTHEIGVRMALGARSLQVRGMVTRQGLVLAGIGIGLGVPGVIAVTRVIGSAMEGFGRVEPAVVFAVAAILAATTLLASWMPARRAAEVDPAVALREG